MSDALRPGDRTWFWIAIGIVTAVRVVAVAFYPATGFPDRFGYLAYADIIQSGTAWLHAAPPASPLPTTVFRAAGYPLLLASLQSLFGANGFSLAVQILQTAATIAACIPLFRAVRRLVNPPTAALSVLGFGLSVNLAYELSLLPDALVATAWITILSVCLLRWLDEVPLRPIEGLGLGVLAVYVVMARGNGMHLLLLTFPIVALATLQSGTSRIRRSVALLVVFLPSALCQVAVQEWNEYRTGERFFTTGAQIALVQPVFRMARLGAAPFVGDDPLRSTIREKAPDLLYEQIYDVNRALYVDQGMTPKQIADANIRLYLDTIGAFPGAFARMFATNLDEKLAIGLINPAFGLHEAHRLVLGERALPGFSAIIKRGEGGIAAIPYAILYGICMLISVIVFAAALLGVPILIAIATRRGSWTRPVLAAGALWLTCGALIAYYCALFMELRYVIMASPFLIAIGLWSLTARKNRSMFA